MMLIRCLKFSSALLLVLTNQSFATQNLNLVKVKIAGYLLVESSKLHIESISDSLNIDARSIEEGAIHCSMGMGRCSLIYRSYVREGLSATRVAWFNVERLEMVAVLKEDVITGDKFSYELVEFKYKFIQLGLNPKRGLLGSNKYRVDLKKGAVVRNIDLERNPIISENEKVIINVYSGLISLRTEGIALSSGILGEKIKVVRLSNKQVLNALIMSNNEVEIR